MQQSQTRGIALGLGDGEASVYIFQSVALHSFMKWVMFLILGISVKKSVPPGECRSIVAHKIHVVEVMETSSSIEWNQM